MARPDIIRTGDRVRILTPRAVVRVGYPKSVADYSASIREQQRLPIKDLMLAVAGRNIPDYLYKRIESRICRELGYLQAKAEGFGGRTRSLHFEDRPELAGAEAWVEGIRSVMTGTYYPPSGSMSLWSDDYEPGGLADQKQHRLVQLTPRAMTNLYDTHKVLEIPIYFLEKIREPVTA